MLRKQHSELIAGLFVLLSLATVLGIVLWLGASDFFKKTSQRAVFYVEEKSGSTGLSVGNAAQIADLVIGKIAEIRIDPASSRAFYYVNISDGSVKIHSDAAARASVGLVGQGKLVITSRGSDGKPLADEANPVPISGGLDQAMANITTVSEELVTIARTVQKELDAAQSTAVMAKVHAMMDELKKAALNITGVSDNIAMETDAKKPGSMLAKIHASADDINAITSDARPKLQKTLTAIENAAVMIEGYTRKDVGEMLAGLREVNTKVQKIATDFTQVSEQAKLVMTVNRERIDEIVDNMSQVSDDLKATMKEVRRNPWRLLYRPDQKELKSQNIYDAARAYNTAASQLEEAVGKLSTLSKSNPNGIPSSDPQLDHIRKDLQDSVGNFNKAEQALWNELVK